MKRTYDHVGLRLAYGTIAVEYRTQSKKYTNVPTVPTLAGNHQLSLKTYLIPFEYGNLRFFVGFRSTKCRKNEHQSKFVNYYNPSESTIFQYQSVYSEAKFDEYSDFAIKDCLKL